MDRPLTYLKKTVPDRSSMRIIARNRNDHITNLRTGLKITRKPVMVPDTCDLHSGTG